MDRHLTDKEVLDMKEKVDRLYLIIAGDERMGLPGLAQRMDEGLDKLEQRIEQLEEQNQADKAFRDRLNFGYRILLVLAGVVGFLADKAIDFFTSK